MRIRSFFRLNEFLSILSFATVISKLFLAPRDFEGAATTAILVIVSGLMIAATIVAGFYALDVAMIYNGVAPEIALFITCLWLLTATIIVTGICYVRLRKSHKKLKSRPSLSPLREILEAFTKGFSKH